MLTPSFHFNILESFSYVMNEQSNVLVSRIKQLTEDKPSGVVLNLTPLIINAAMDIICGECNNTFG